MVLLERNFWTVKNNLFVKIDQISTSNSDLSKDQQCWRKMTNLVSTGKIGALLDGKSSGKLNHSHSLTVEEKSPSDEKFNKAWSKIFFQLI